MVPGTLPLQPVCCLGGNRGEFARMGKEGSISPEPQKQYTGEAIKSPFFWSREATRKPNLSLQDYYIRHQESPLSESHIKLPGGSLQNSAKRSLFTTLTEPPGKLMGGSLWNDAIGALLTFSSERSRDDFGSVANNSGGGLARSRFK